MRSTLLGALGGVGAGFLGALCCIGPLLFVTFGVGAGLAATFEPLRPVFAVVMVAAFGIAFYTVYGRAWLRPSAESDCCVAGEEACAPSWSRTREKVILWTALVVVLLFWTFPTWSTWLV